MTKNNKTFSDEERAAAQEYVRELKAGDKAKTEEAVLEKIKSMPEPDRSMAKKVHEIVMKTAPTLRPRTWYGMPAYANKDGRVVCFFQNASKFKYRYSTLGFQEDARLDEGNFWPVSYAITKLTSTEEAKIAALVKKAVS